MKFLKQILKSFYLIVLLLSCDFTPRIHKDILVAQDFIRSQKYEKAIFHYEKILKKNPNSDIKTKINYQLGDLYSIYLSKNRKALTYYTQIIKDSEDPLWLVRTEERIGEIYFSYLKEYRKSLKIYLKLSQFIPKLARQDFYRFRYSLSLFNLGKLEEASKVFKQISKDKRHKYYVRSFYFLGMIEFQRKNWDKALNQWREYLKHETKEDYIIQAKFLMANAYETKEELKKAYNLYYSILSVYPNTEVIQNRLKAIFNRRIARKR